VVTASSGRLKGKRALVIGAGQTSGETVGNGRATAITFAREGASVVVVDRDEVSLEQTRALIADAGGSAEALVADVTTEDACREIASSAGRIDVLHHNVGVGAGDASPTRLTEDAWDRIIDVNLKAMWLMCKHVVPIMREQGSGSIVCISSVAAIAAAGNLTAYKVSKAGVNALVQNLAVTNARYGIRVNGIMPGLIDTPMAVDAIARTTGQPREAVAAARAERVPMRHQGTAWDVANAALFLASDDAAFITGVILPVDGGQSAMVG
jgi:NAD(P)-dependent dehydrogenase (short-subunit alcohol dehydrogenase family)